MAKLVAKLQKIFADIGVTGASGYQVTQFGSLKAGAPLATSDPTTVQALDAYGYGFINGIINGAPPAIQDIDGLCNMLTKGVGYLQQSGISEYNAGDEYFIGSIVAYHGSTASTTGQLFISVVDNNIGNALSDTTKWMIYKSHATRTDTTNLVSIAYDDYHVLLGCDDDTDTTLPRVGDHNKGRILFFSTFYGSRQYTFWPTGTDTIDGASTFVRLNPDRTSASKSTITFQSDGVHGWIIIGVYHAY